MQKDGAVTEESKIMSRTPIAIYGAQMVGVSVYYAITTLYKNADVTCFIVTDRQGNPDQIDGIPVMELDEFCRKVKNSVRILLALPENHHAFIIEQLKKRHMNDYVCIDSESEARLMKQYYAAIGAFPDLHDMKKGNEKAELAIYMTRFHKDQSLTQKYHMPHWVYSIQAGADLTDVCIADIQDNLGDNISHKNNNYSELSALYWIGRYAKEEWIGLMHYRRILDISDDDLYRLKENRLDVILPYPTMQFPDNNNHHRRYLNEGDWQTLLRVLNKLAPQYAQALPKIFAEKFFYNYNMLLARKEVLKKYCDWLFPILECVEEESVPKGCERSDRYIGYMGESLCTLYFMYHKEDYRIAHVARRMLV